MAESTRLALYKPISATVIKTHKKHGYLFYVIVLKGNYWYCIDFNRRLTQRYTKYIYKYSLLEHETHSYTIALPADRILERLFDERLACLIHGYHHYKDHWYDIFMPLVYQFDRQKVIKPPGIQRNPAYIANDYKPVKTKIIRDKISLYIGENAPYLSR